MLKNFLFLFFLLFFVFSLSKANTQVVVSDVVSPDGNVSIDLEDICKGQKDRNYGLVGYDGGVCDSRSGGEAIGSLIQNGLSWIIRVSFMLGTLALLYSGFVLLFSNANPQKKQQAVSIFRNVIIGLFLVSAAYLLVQWVFDLFNISDEYRMIESGDE